MDNRTLNLRNVAYRLYALALELPQLAALKGARLCMHLGAVGHRALARQVERAFALCPKLMGLALEGLCERLFLAGTGLDHAEAPEAAREAAPKADGGHDALPAHDDDRELRIQKEDNELSSFCDDDDDNAGAHTHARGAEAVASGKESAAEASRVIAEEAAAEASGNVSEGASEGGRLPVDYRRWTAEQFRVQARRCRGTVDEGEWERFVTYWTAADPRGRMRFQKQRTFSCVERLQTWVRKSRAYALEHEAELKSRFGRPMEPPTVEEVVRACADLGADAEEGRSFHHYYAAIGWRQGKHYIEDWRSALQRWLALGRKRHGEEARGGRRGGLLAVNVPLAEAMPAAGATKGDGMDSLTGGPQGAAANANDDDHEHTFRNSGGGWDLQQQVDGLYRAKINELRHIGAEEDRGGLFGGLELDPDYLLPEVVGGGVAPSC